MSNASGVPHANKAGLLCTLVRIIAAFPTLTYEGLAFSVGLTRRHLDYYVDAAAQLGFVVRTPGGLRATFGARHLVATLPGSAEQCANFLAAIQGEANLNRWVLGGLSDAELEADLRTRGLSASSARDG